MQNIGTSRTRDSIVFNTSDAAEAGSLGNIDKASVATVAVDIRVLRLMHAPVFSRIESDEGSREISITSLSHRRLTGNDLYRCGVAEKAATIVARS
jgi:hypothetical protein